ncbi:MAG: glycosyltransferase [Planctomycetaceae bacterium]|nr:glycosyltransferase [Planctomycetaceae bacterium]
MIKIALCITELNIGGAEQALSQLAAALDKNRFAAEVYSLQKKPQDANSSCVPFLESADIPLHFLNMEGAVSFLPALFRLKTLLKKQKPDVFLSFMFHANFLGRLAAAAASVPHIISGIRVAEKKAKHHNTLDYLTQRFVNRYVCVSKSVADFAVQTVKLPPEKILVIPNGVDTSKFRPADFHKKKEQILFIGRLEEQKGIDWLFDTIAETHLLERMPETELNIAGDGPMQKTLEVRLQEKEFSAVKDRIHFLGWQKDLQPLFASAKLLVLPSRWEGMPNVLQQAMASGLPVAATETEGVAEVLGILSEKQMTDFGNTEAFAKLIRDIMTQDNLREELGRQNRQRVCECFSMEETVRQYEELFSSLVRL